MIQLCVQKAFTCALVCIVVLCPTTHERCVSFKETISIPRMKCAAVFMYGSGYICHYFNHTHIKINHRWPVPITCCPWENFVVNTLTTAVSVTKKWILNSFVTVQGVLSTFCTISYIMSIVLRHNIFVTPLVRTHTPRTWLCADARSRFGLAEISPTPFGSNFMNSLWQFEPRLDDVQKK